jgi:transmembrane sensor
MTPKPELSSHIVAEATPHEIAQQWAAIEPRLARRPRLRRLLPLSLAFAGAAAIFAMVYVHRVGPKPPWTTQNEAMTLALDDGSHLQLRPHSIVRPLRQRKGEAFLRVERGGARFEVRPGPTRRFQVSAAGIDVVVTGTVFSVGLEAGQASPRVSVEHGEVEVHPQGETRLLARLHAGETWPAPPEPPVAPPETAAPPAATPATRTLPPAAAPASASSARRTVPVDSRQLLEAANAARRSGDVVEAASLLEILQARFPRDPRAALASFELGRLRLDVLGDLPGAVTALKQSIALAPSGVFREDAEACLATAYARMRDRLRCEKARLSYLARYPEGTHAAEMSALGCP